MMSLADQIIDRIKRNRISSTEVADCLDKTGAIEDVLPLNTGHFRVGKIFWAYAYNESNWEVHEQARYVPEGHILLVETLNCAGRAIFGQLVAKYLMLYRQAAAIVVKGRLRDVPHLIKEGWPIWYEGPTPIGCFNHKVEQQPDTAWVQQRRSMFHGGIAVCDDSGVVVIPKEHQNEEFLQRLDWIEELEDTWFDCIDRRKWDTYETVCLKRYLENQQ